MSEWQDISTAPKDGTDILIYAHGMAIQARFCPGEWSHSIDGSEWDGPVWSAFDDAVTFEVEDCGEHGMWHGPVTHWMPLPPPPYATKADSDDRAFANPAAKCGHPACNLYGRCMTGDCQLRARNTLADSDGDDGA